MTSSKGCGKEFDSTCYSLVGTSFTSKKICGWFKGEGKKKYLCPECQKKVRISEVKK